MEGRLVQKYRLLFKKHFSYVLSNTFMDFVSDMGVTDHRHYNR